MSRRTQFLGLLGWLAVAFCAAALGAIASMEAGAFYSGLERPAWAPRGTVFGPVWSILYTSMGLAAWLVWRDGGWARQRHGLSLFLVQLSANALWSWLFFAWRLGAVATFEIVILWGLVAWTVWEFWRRKCLAGVLLIPYLAWVSFACALCFTVWRMNPSQL